MLNKEQLENILYQFSSFPRDFLPLENQLMKMVNIYAKTIDYAWDVFKEANDSSFISTTRTLSTIPYFKISIADALYDLQTARMLARMSFEEQVAYLDKEGKYTSFRFDGKDNAGEPVVYHMRLFVDFDETNQLNMYEDYFFRSNRLYLLPSYVQRRNKPVNYLHAFDIKYNDFSLEKNYGSLYNLQAGPLLPRYEYRDTLEAFIRAFSGNMTIRSLKESIQLATKWERFKVEDRLSPDISKRKLELYDNWVISPNQFLVTLPEYLIPDKVKVNIIRTLLHETKEVDKDFMIFFDVSRREKLPIPDKNVLTLNHNRRERLSCGDNPVAWTVIRVKDYPLDLFSRYDTVFYYNFNLKYDDPRNVEDEMNTLSKVTINHRTLQIPREFGFVNVTETFKRIGFSTGLEGAAFELYGAEEEYGEYVLLEELTGVANHTTATFAFPINAQGPSYFKARSKRGEETSLFTIAITNREFGFSEDEVVNEDHLINDENNIQDKMDTADFVSKLLGIDKHPFSE